MAQLSIGLRASAKGSEVSTQSLHALLDSACPSGPFADQESVAAAYRACAQAGALPESSSNAGADAQLRAVCDALLIFHLTPLLHAALVQSTFHRCLPTSLEQRPLQLVLQWAQQRGAQMRKNLDAGVVPSGALYRAARESPSARDAASQALAAAAGQLKAIEETFRKLPLPSEAATRDAEAGAAAAYADSLRCRLVEWLIANALHAEAPQLSPPPSAASPLFSYLREAISVSRMGTRGGGGSWGTLTVAAPSSNPLVTADLLYAILLESEQAGEALTTLAAEAAHLLLTPARAQWLRACHLAFHGRAPALARRLWYEGHPPTPNEGSQGELLAAELAKLTATVHELQFGVESGADADPFMGLYDRFAGGGDVRKCPSITTRRKIHALVGRGQGSDIYLAQPEQALFLCRHPDDAESKEARFGALIEACERAGCLARLAR